jgi:hypothetical protein
LNSTKEPQSSNIPPDRASFTRSIVVSNKFESAPQKEADLLLGKKSSTQFHPTNKKNCLPDFFVVEESNHAHAALALQSGQRLEKRLQRRPAAHQIVQTRRKQKLVLNASNGGGLMIGQTQLKVQNVRSIALELMRESLPNKPSIKTSRKRVCFHKP